MLPVLFSIGNQPISSFGLFLLISLLSASYFIWRISRVYEFDEEKVIDLILLTFVGGLIFSRAYFIIFHLPQFENFQKMLLINRYSGLSFWGGLFGGLLTLVLFSKRMKLSFYQMADAGVAGLFIALFLSSIGCLLGSCQYGLPFNGPLAILQIGLIDPRFPLQLIEGLIFLIMFVYFWRATIKFHFNGQIFAKGLIFLGLVKLFFEPFRGDKQIIFQSLSAGMVLSVALVLLGLRVYYSQGKRSLKADLRFLLSVFYKSNKRKLVISRIIKSWYNLFVNTKLSVGRLKRVLLKSLNVKANPTKF